MDAVKRMIEENLYLTISVCDLSGHPWIANLFYVFDRNYNFYWYSPKTSKHSKLIQENSNVAISIFNSQATGDEIDAVYVKAKAYMLDDRKKMLRVLLLYGKKMLKAKFVNSKDDLKNLINNAKDFTKESPLRLYKATPEEIFKLAPSQIYHDKY